MKAYTPNRFLAGAVVDAEVVNDNLRALASRSKRNQGARYTYSCLTFPLDGIVNTDGVAVRSFVVDVPSTIAGFKFTVDAVELVVCAASGATWVLSSSVSTWPGCSVVTVAATTEASAICSQPIDVDGSPSSVTFTVSSSASSTIARGYLVVHLRTNRYVQPNAVATEYVPTLLSATSSTAGTVLDTELNALATAVANDAAATYDLRAEVVCLRNIAAGVTYTFSLPNGAGRTALQTTICASGAAAANVNVTVTGATVAAMTCTGTGNTVTATKVQSNGVEAPFNLGSDTTVAMAFTVGTVSVVYAIIWWS